MFSLLLRRLRPAAGLLLLLPLLSGCDRQVVNAQLQAGAWHIQSVRVQPSLDPTSATTVTDVGDVSFTALAESSRGSEAVFYFDKAIASRYFVTVANSAGVQLPAKLGLYYTPDSHERHRVVLSYYRSTAADIVGVYTLSKASEDHQSWLYLGLDREGRVNYREEWELERL